MVKQLMNGVKMLTITLVYALIVTIETNTIDFDTLAGTIDVLIILALVWRYEGDVYEIYGDKTEA